MYQWKDGEAEYRIDKMGLWQMEGDVWEKANPNQLAWELFDEVERLASALSAERERCIHTISDMATFASNEALEAEEDGDEEKADRLRIEAAAYDKAVAAIERHGK